MKTIARRATLAVAAVAAAATTVMSSGTAAHASTWAVESDGTAIITLDPLEVGFWAFTGGGLCNDLTFQINGDRQRQGRTLGVSTQECMAMVGFCLQTVDRPDDGVIFAKLTIHADNTYLCEGRHR